MAITTRLRMSPSLFIQDGQSVVTKQNIKTQYKLTISIADPLVSGLLLLTVLLVLSANINLRYYIFNTSN